MSKKEAQRPAVLDEVLDGQMAQAEGRALNRSVRQVLCRLVWITRRCQAHASSEMTAP